VANRSRSTRQGHFVVCGDTPLAYRLVEELTDRMGVEVTSIVTDKHQNQGPRIAALAGVRVVEAQELNDNAFHAADVVTARALALVSQDDVGNLHAALRAAELNPTIRLVIRMFNMSLGHRIRTLFADCAVLSDSAMAAPWFVAAALGELAPTFVRLPGRTMYVGHRSEVPADRVVCGIADTEHSGRPRLLPPDESTADLVLAIADGSSRDPLSRHRRWSNPLRVLLDGLRAALNRRLTVAFLGLFGLLMVSTVLFATAGHNPWPEAVYLTLLDAAGAAQPDPNLSGVNKFTQVMVTIVGISVIPLVTAVVVDAVVGARLAAASGRLRGPVRDHFVLIGLGNVGSRVLTQLRDLGLPVVCVERNQNATGVLLARRLGVPVVIGDASREETLRSAWVGTSRAVLALTSDDVTNLQAALHVRALREQSRVVLRLFDGDLAQRVQRTLGIGISRSVSFLAAPAFAAAMMERQVIGTIAVGRRVLLIAELPVAACSDLLGRALSEVDERGEARVLALRENGAPLLDWDLNTDHELVHDDRVLVIATRTGLAHLLSPTPSA
jgi:Trk K+ transport system NAD-binding subunit